MEKRARNGQPAPTTPTPKASPKAEHILYPDRSPLACIIFSTTMATNSTNTNTSNTKTASVAILIGSSSGGGGGGKSGGGGGGSNSTNTTVPVVVWANQERTSRDSNDDKWKRTLEYYEFYDDIARWTHLDQLLLRFGSSTVSSIHVGSSEALSSSSSSSSKNGKNAASNNKNQRRLERIMEKLQGFLDDRMEEDNNNNDSNNETVCQLHTHVTVDYAKIEASLSQLLLEDADVRLAVRGNLKLSSSSGGGGGGLVQQGLALWLQAEGLMGSGKNSASTGIDDNWAHSCKLQEGVLTSHLVMDRTAAQCIHLLPPANAGVATVVGGNTHNNSLWGVLSKPCLTQGGKQLVQLWLRQPLIDLEQIQNRQTAVTNLRGLPKDGIRDALKAFTGVDLGGLANTLGSYAAADDDNNNGSGMSTKKSLRSLYQLYLLSSQKMPQLAEAATSGIVVGDNNNDDNNNNNTSSPLLRNLQIKLVELVGELERCQGLVEAVLDLDQAPREYLLKPDFSPELGELYNELKDVQTAVDEELEEMQSTWGEYNGNKSQVKLEQLDGDTTAGTWQFRLSNTNDAKTLQTLGNKVQVHRILKNGVYFSTKTLRQLSSKYQELTQEYNHKSQKVVKDAMSVATTYQTVVERAAECVSTLDVLCGLAHTADYSPHGYCQPTMTDTEEDGAGIVLEQARHPCVELQEDVSDYIANDISLIFGESNFLLVTGPNMGGKSTYIRALGAIVCMAQIGSYVPCKAATINICHSILARVGAGDLQERGISTFMAEMLESSSILRTATKRSLIIIDELGRGTSTFDGYGLARAISEYLMKRIGCCTVFATHFHELTQQLDGAQNCHVTAEKGSQGLTFLYKVQPGPCLESFGIQVAEMANVPACVIQDAKRKAAELESFGSHKRSKTNNSSNTAFVERFKGIDLPSILKETTSDEEKRTQLLQLLQ